VIDHNLYDDKLLEGLSDHPSNRSVAALIGEEAFALLSRHLGGRLVYIPYRVRPGSPLAMVIGLDAAQKISDIYGGLSFEIGIVMGRKARIKQALADGMPVYQIAHRLGVSRSTINRVQAELADKNQPDLFNRDDL